MIPAFFITYASTGGPITNTDIGISINFTQPGNVIAKASWDAGAHLFRGTLFPNWNYTLVGPWNPTVVVSDPAGNAGRYAYTGSPYVISPATLSTTIQLVDSKTNQTIAQYFQRRECYDLRHDHLSDECRAGQWIRGSTRYCG